MQFSFASPAMQVLVGSPWMSPLAYQDLATHWPGIRVPASLLSLGGLTNTGISFTQSKMTQFHIPTLNFLTKSVLPLLSYRAFYQEQPGALLIFIAHDDIFLINNKWGAQAARGGVKIDGIPWNVYQRCL